MNTIATARRITLAAAATATLLAGAASFGGSAFAAGHSDVNPNGYVTVESCTSLAGTVHLTPGLLKKSRAESVFVTGTLDGCSFEGMSQPGQGSFTAVVSGMASATAGTLSGTFTANWPASAGLNPSNGTVIISNSAKGLYTISGAVTGGALVGAYVSTGYVVTGTQGTGAKKNPIIEQNFVNTASFNLAENLG